MTEQSERRPCKCPPLRCAVGWGEPLLSNYRCRLGTQPSTPDPVCDTCGAAAIESVLDHITGGRLDYCPEHDPVHATGGEVESVQSVLSKLDLVASALDSRTTSGIMRGLLSRLRRALQDTPSKGGT